MDQAIRAEDEAARFCGTAAEQSKSRLEALREKAGQALSITGD